MFHRALLGGNTRCTSEVGMRRASGRRRARRIKKESFRRGREAFLLFRGLSWSQGRNGKWCLRQFRSSEPGLFHGARREENLLLLLRRLLSRLLRGLLSLLCHGAVTSFLGRRIYVARILPSMVFSFWLRKAIGCGYGYIERERPHFRSPALSQLLRPGQFLSLLA